MQSPSQRHNSLPHLVVFTCRRIKYKCIGLHWLLYNQGVYGRWWNKMQMSKMITGRKNRVPYAFSASAFYFRMSVGLRLSQCLCNSPSFPSLSLRLHVFTRVSWNVGHLPLITPTDCKSSFLSRRRRLQTPHVAEYNPLLPSLTCCLSSWVTGQKDQDICWRNPESY